MKLNSGLVAALLTMFSVKSIAEIAVEQYNRDVANEVAKAMTPEACDTFATLCANADGRKKSVWLNADDPRWIECGFDQMTKDEMMIFRRLHEHYGREIALTKDGMMVSPMTDHPAKKPMAVPATVAANVVPFEKQGQVPYSGPVASKAETIAWLKTADLSDLVPAGKALVTA